MTKTIKLWWLAAGIMVILFGFTCLMDYLRNFAHGVVVTSAPYSVFMLVRAIEFLIPALLFALIALYLGWKHRQKHEAKKHHESSSY